MLPASMFTIKKKYSPSVDGENFKISSKSRSDGGICSLRGKQPGWDGEEEGFEMSV